MDADRRRERLLDFERRCRDHGLPLTLQRRAILEAALDLDAHPSADDIHDLVVRRMPGISRTTIYRTLDTLVRLGVVDKLCHPGRAVRYDRRIDLHHHLICTTCDRVSDIDADAISTPVAPVGPLRGFTVHDVRVELRGLCNRCRVQEEGQ